MAVGAGRPLLDALIKEKGVTAAFVHHARGAGVSGQRRKGTQIEKDLVTVAVPADVADEVFEFLFHEGKISQPHGGFMWMEKGGALSVSPGPEVAAQE